MWTIPMFVGLFVVLTPLLPLIVLATLAADGARIVVRRRASGITRLTLFGWWYVATVNLALILIFGVWVLSGFGLRRQRLVEWTFGLQSWWAHALFAGFMRLFGATLEVEGAEVLRPGPILLFMRHASIADVLLPNVIVTGRHGLRLRYVLKKELLLDPAMDIAGNRLPNHFVLRGSGNGAVEVERVGNLAGDLGDEEGVIIYPEGTRFSLEKRSRAIAFLARRDPDLAGRAERLRHTLPPRLGGPLALLERGEGLDVVFLGHIGFDGLAEIKDILSGGLVHTRIRVGIWRVPASEVPRGRREQTDWLFDRWEEMDRWVGDHLAEAP
jgi:1-acyl-sn-glycerol-3-phosphate acyltransferase